MTFLRMILLLYKTSLKIVLLLRYRLLLKNLLTCLREAETKSPRLLITNIAIVLCLVMTLVLISFCSFTSLSL